MKKHKLLLIITLFLASCAPQIQYEGERNEKREYDPRETVAILDFEGRGISQLESQTLTDRFRTAFASVGVFRLVERKMMEEELQEQGFQLKGCISYECAVEVGKLLGVQNMISGAVGMLGDKTWTIDMRMFSVQTGVNIRAKNVSYDGAVDGLVTEIEILAYEISGRKAADELLLIRKVVNPNPTSVVSEIKSSGISISGFIAVLEFEGNDVSPSETRALTDRLRTELVGTGQLTIIERGKMEEVLEEQSFQQTGCVSSECAVEVGKLLGVEQIVTGNISKVGTLFSVTARVVSVQSGEIVRSTIYDHSGDIGGLLTQGMKKVAEELGK